MSSQRESYLPAMPARPAIGAIGQGSAYNPVPVPYDTYDTYNYDRGIRAIPPQPRREEKKRTRGPTETYRFSDTIIDDNKHPTLNEIKQQDSSTEILERYRSTSVSSDDMSVVEDALRDHRHDNDDDVKEFFATEEKKDLSTFVSRYISEHKEDVKEHKGEVIAGASDADDGTICPICKETLKASLVSPCGHLICQKCVILHKEDLNKCPVCRASIEVSSFYPCYNIGKAIEALHKTSVERYCFDFKQSSSFYMADRMKNYAEAKRAQNLNLIMEVVIMKIKKAASMGKFSIIMSSRRAPEISQYLEDITCILKEMGYTVCNLMDRLALDIELHVFWK
jgi:rubrerythrin